MMNINHIILNDMKTVRFFIPLLILLSGAAISCSEEEFGANPYDPNTPITVSEWPKVISFTPEKGAAGDEITITGKNFTTAVKVTFGNSEDASFEIIDDNTIKAVLSSYGNSGAVAVTNHKGERSAQGFVYLWPEVPSENPNLALNCVATSSEPFSGFSAAGVNDGQTGAGAWVAANNDEGADRWVMIELNDLSEINKVVLYWDPNAAGTDYKLEYSEDGNTFTTIFEETGWVSNGDDNGVKTIKFDPVNAKYVRIGNLYNSITGYNMTLWEFEIYNTPPPTNVALEKPATADCEANAGSMFHITDGKLANMWQCNNDGHDPHWAIVDLGVETAIDNVVIYMDGGAYATSMKISLAGEDEVYSEVYAVEGWSSEAVPREPGSAWTMVVMDAAFEEKAARYIRLDFGVASSPWGINLYEVEAYNQW